MSMSSSGRRRRRLLLLFFFFLLLLLPLLLLLLPLPPLLLPPLLRYRRAFGGLARLGALPRLPRRGDAVRPAELALPPLLVGC